MSASCCPVCGSAQVELYPTPFADRIVRCEACGTRFVHPVPSRKALQQRYEAEHRSGKWGSLFEAGDPGEPPRRAQLLADLCPDMTPGRRLLDVGCGDGRFLAAAVSAGFRPIGIELSWTAVGPIRGRYPVAVAGVEALREGPQFAVVTFWDVLEHLPDPARTVRAAASVLEPGGLLAATLPSAAGTEALVHGSKWRFHDLGAYGHLIHVGPAQLRRLFESTGLEVVYRETRGSVDLRNLLGSGSGRGVSRPLAWLLDRVSGVVARVAEPALRGNTLLMVARRSAA